LATGFAGAGREGFTHEGHRLSLFTYEPKSNR
jgi:hypothetical protein